MANSTKISEYSTTAANNTSIDSIDIDENCAASGINNAIRSVLKHQADAFTQGTPIALDQTNNRVGIGTASPATALDVTGTVTADQLDVDNITIDGNTISSTDTNGDITLDPDGTGDLIVASGNVGINDTTPDRRLHVKDSSNRVVLVESTDPNVFTVYKGSGTTDDGKVRVGATGDNALIYAGGSERMRIDSSGNVGIGTTAPSQRMSVEGTANNQNSEIKVTATGVASGYLGSNSDGFNIGTDSHGIVFKTGVTGGGSVGNTGTVRMVIDGSGDVQLGGSTTRAKVNVERNDASSYNYASISVSNQPDHFVFYTDSTVTGSITRSGGTGVNYNTSSDHRLKEAVVDMTGAITRVKSLAPKRFNFIADADRTVDGFLAHEAQSVVPEAVTGTHNEVDDDGNAVMQGIDQSKLVPLLTGALQEAIAKIETLETEMTALKARVTALEA